MAEEATGGDGLRIAFFGSSLVSSWWNGACTYYRGIIAQLHRLGHHITFYEPVAYGRQEHRDIDDPPYAEVVVYQAEDEQAVRRVVRGAAGADVVVKTSGVGVFDEVLEEEVAAVGASGTIRLFWDVDAPATLAALRKQPSAPFHGLLPHFDAVLTYGGGMPVVEQYLDLGARWCEVVYNAVDPDTHHRVAPDPRFDADCALLANRLPDREARIDAFFFESALLLPHMRFLLGGNGWEGRALPANVRWIGHVGTHDHNAFNSTATAILNVTRDSMAANGWSPPTRVFEAAGAAACLITDSWLGVEDFLLPGSEVLVAADARQVADHLVALHPEQARAIGERAVARVLQAHTYGHRAVQVDRLLRHLVEIHADEQGPGGGREWPGKAASRR